MIGKMLAHYEITSRLGKGGMGEVYQAKDQKLGREVAIKVLPEEFARDTDRVARFQREAKLLASLNHPNIAAIYGLEESGGTNFLVLELVEGDTLADRIKAGPVPVEEALKLALQIAEALEAAHEKGVIHRDLKPANIKVTPDGKVKVLDFGLAKAFAGDQAELNLSNSPTLTRSPTLSDMATMQGVILGTAAYMSPEQARGKSVDKKADVWAFGCVLFEMITGRVAFSGKDVTDILAAVIRSEPEWTTLPPNLHGRLREVLERCMKKDAKDRYHDISDVKADIQRVLTDSSGVLVQPVMAAEPRRKLRTIFPWVAAALILGAILAGVAVWKLKPSGPRQVMRSEYRLPEGQQLNNVEYPTLAVSPDGRQFVYVTAKGLYLRSMDEFDAKPINGTDESPAYPFFSPDGKWIGYFSVADLKLKKIAIGGGAPVTLCDANIVVGASWGADGKIVYAEYLKGIESVSANGGTPELIVKGPMYHPQFLPDGKSLLFTLGSAPPYKIVVQSLQSGERRELFAGDKVRYIPTGHMIYSLGYNLFSVPFDLKSLKVAGGPVSVVEGIWRTTPERTPQYAVSDAGTLIYIPGQTRTVAALQRALVWVDQKGKEESISAVPNDYRMPRISPDGTRVALTIYTGQKSDIWIWDLARETMTRLTFNEASAGPLWTLDGQRIAFVSSSAVYWKAADGTGEDEKLGSAADRGLGPWSWSSDGKTLVVLEFPGGLNWDIGSLSMEGDHKWRSLLHEKYIELQPKISPDGRWMAYMSSESGRAEVYVRPFPEINKGRWQVSTSGGNSPLWSPDGRKLFYRSGDAGMVVPVETEPAFRPGKPEALFRGAYVGLSLDDAHTWDISPDGKRFLMIKEAVSTASPAAPEGPRKINIVVNWFEELKQRVPVK
jgi:eukaryotic-like serine/threonine-protein kinase